MDGICAPGSSIREIFVDGKPTRIATPQDAIDAGIGMVHQHFMLVDNLTVAENVLLGSEPHRRRCL